MIDTTAAVPGDGAIDPARVDIIIVNWNAGPLLADCLRSVERNGGSAVARVFVVDNGSTDGSADVSVPGLPLEVIRANRNLGFGRACNLAARRATAPYILFLNPDAEVYAGAVDRVLAYLETPGNERVGAAGIRLEGRDGLAQRHCARFPTWRSFVGGSLNLTRIAPRWFPPVLMTDFDHLSSRDVDHVIGAFYVIRRGLFMALGGFDERFFVYLEDLDLSARIHGAGFSIRYLADATAYHKEGGTSQQVKAHRLFYSLHSRMIYAFKHLSWPAAFAVALVTYAVEPFTRSARALLLRSGNELFHTWQAFGMLCVATPELIRTAAAMRSDTASETAVPAR